MGGSVKYRPVDKNFRTSINPNIEVSRLELLVNSDDLHVAVGLAKNVNASPKILRQLWKKWSKTRNSVVVNIVVNPNTSPSLAARIIQQYKWKDVFVSVAGNSNTPVHILKELVCDNRQVVNNLLSNPSTPVEIFEPLMDLHKDNLSMWNSILEVMLARPEYADWPLEWIEESFPNRFKFRNYR